MGQEQKDFHKKMLNVFILEISLSLENTLQFYNFVLQVVGLACHSVRQAL